MAKDDPNTIRYCYTKATGRYSEDNQREFMDWCEARVVEWKTMITAKGYDSTRWSIPEDYHGTLHYHEWLKERVGL